MTKTIVTMAVAVAMVFGSAGDSTPFLLDTMDGPRIAREVETIAYSPHWNGSVSCSVTVTASTGDGNGNVALVVSATEEGATTWCHPATYGLYTVTHMAGGEKLEAQFIVPDPFPDVGGDADVAGALARAVDSRLGRHIKTDSEYNAYRGWVDANGIDHETVKNSPRAWFSYALDASNLVECAFQNGDVTIVSLEAVADGTFMFEVDVKGVLLGASATAANLATVFEIQGSPSLSEDLFSPNNVDATMGVSANGRLTVTVTPKAAHSTFFVRVRMHADDDGWPVDPHGKVQLWKNGPYWATTNIGAEKPEEYGYYFWWGDTIGYKRENDAWVASDESYSNFSFGSENTPTYGKDTSTLQSEGWVCSQDGTYVLASEHDAAHVHWGGDWRMPTRDEQAALINNCDWTWTTKNGVKGYIVRGGGDWASNSIFLPATGSGYGTSLINSDSAGGYYWSSVPGSSSGNSSWRLSFYFDDLYVYDQPRGGGYPVRPVMSVESYSVKTYMVVYNPGTNGTGTPQTAMKTRDVVLTLKSATFKRDGYIQTGWATIDGGARAYELGESYTVNAAITLYPYWTASPSVDPHGKVQLWKNGPYWATTNIGAEKPEEYGYYFWWGDTVGYKRENNAWVATDGSSLNFSFGPENTLTDGKDTSTLQSEGWIISQDGTYVLAPEHDAAHVQRGSGWRMPTDLEQSDLNSKCDWTWVTMNGVNGYVVCGQGDYSANSIFLPAAGYGDGTSLNFAGSDGFSWSSVPCSNYNYSSWYLYFCSAGYGTRRNYRFRSFPVRPVQGFTE